MAGKKFRLIFGLAELTRKLKTFDYESVDYKQFRLWAVEPKLKWLPTWMMYLLLLSVSLMLQNLRPSVITRSFEITRIIHFKEHAGHLLECWFHFIIRISDFFDGFSADIRRTKIKQRIQLSIAACMGVYRQRLSEFRVHLSDNLAH